MSESMIMISCEAKGAYGVCILHEVGRARTKTKTPTPTGRKFSWLACLVLMKARKAVWGIQPSASSQFQVSWASSRPHLSTRPCVAAHQSIENQPAIQIFTTQGTTAKHARPFPRSPFFFLLLLILRTTKQRNKASVCDGARCTVCWPGRP
jgi:hypothetical protein